MCDKCSEMEDRIQELMEQNRIMSDRLNAMGKYFHGRVTWLNKMLMNVLKVQNGLPIDDKIE